jgi:cytochrome c-type biogenesis protein CcmE
MKGKRKFLAGAAIIVAALGYLVYSGVSQSAVYFVTPSELAAAPVPGKAYRLGGMVILGSVKWDAPNVALTFALSDGTSTVPVRHVGSPPDLFGEGRGAVVEGTWSGDGYFRSSLIMAKHSEEYKAPHDGAEPGYKELIRTLRSGAAPAKP